MKKIVITCIVALMSISAFAQEQSLAGVIYGDQIELAVTLASDAIADEKKAAFQEATNARVATIMESLNAQLTSIFTPEESAAIVAFYSSAAGLKLKEFEGTKKASLSSIISDWELALEEFAMSFN